MSTLHETGRVEVGELADDFGVNDMTIRRDLAALAEQGQITRVHGGALPARPALHETRASENRLEKEAIARAVAAQVGPNETVGIDAGTTCIAIATELAKRSDLRIVTYSIPVAMALRDSESQAILLGGTMTKDLTLVSGGARYVVDRLALDDFIMSCAGVTTTHGVTFYDAAEVEVRRALAEKADRLVLAIDHSKWDRHATFVFGGIDMYDSVVIDAGAPDAATEYFAAHTQLTIAPLEAAGGLE